MLDKMYDLLANISKGKPKKTQIKLYKYIGIITNIYIRFRYTLKNRFSKKNGITDNGEIEVIVSLTSFPARIHTVFYAIETLMNQTVKPNKIILWLSKEQFSSINHLPKTLLRQRKRGLEIYLVDDDLKGHKKYYYAFRTFPNSKIITFDDDLLYPSYAIERLIDKNKEYPNCVCCNRGHEIKIADGKICSYKEWVKEAIYLNTPTNCLCPTHGAGALFPVNSVDNDVFCVEKIKKYVYYSDDIWLKAMAFKKGTKAVYTNDFPQWLFVIRGSQNVTLAQKNINQNQNDFAISLIMEDYKFNFKSFKD
ncbi:MAG: hypothetical protein EGR97_03870 [Clostridiales bacterium]|nr:hypothetical protein [Clostridiales bacterium]